MNIFYKCSYSALILILWTVQTASAQEFEWRFEDTYRDEALYVHPLINYNFHPLWDLDWEKNFLRSNGFQFTAGSVTTSELLVHSQLTFNNDLENGWWFTARGLWNATRHENLKERTIFLGLERQVIPGASVFLLCHPRFDKEYLDVQMGVSIWNKSREQYFSAALVLNDLVYDSKNDQGGKTSQKPVGIQWYLRFGKGKWWIYSEGNFNTGFEREFPDIEESPLPASHQQRSNRFKLKWYYQWPEDNLFRLSAYYYRFDDARGFYDGGLNYDYQNEIIDLTPEYLFYFRKAHRFRVLMHFLRQKARSIGFSRHTFDRQDLMPAMFYEWLLKEHVLQAGFMFSVHNWDYESGGERDGYRVEQGYFDKVFLSYTHQFTKTAKILFSISHEVSVGGFGGGNIQYQMFF